ncbi:MAG: hypothetical protein E3J72_08465 [Planctomycetota bacterium]|nr:MAG: hypothetical protein E3J72_08465 [Planctomycetota bacterium]
MNSTIVNRKSEISGLSLKLTLFVVLLFSVVISTGCASMGEYFKDRANDLVDPFLFRVSYGIGISALAQATRFGPGAIVGLSDSNKYGFVGRNYTFSEEGCAGLGIFGLRSVPWQKGSRAYLPNHLGMPVKDLEAESVYICGMNNILYFNLLHTIRSNSENPRSEAIKDRQELAHLFWIEADVFCFAGLDVGFNPYEVVDLVLGIFGLDISGDDREERKEEPLEENRGEAKDK